MSSPQGGCWGFLPCLPVGMSQPRMAGVLLATVPWALVREARLSSLPGAWPSAWCWAPVVCPCFTTVGATLQGSVLVPGVLSQGLHPGLTWASASPPVPGVSGCPPGQALALWAL